ncbi:ArsR/SmtB family transcription factor [Quadrisphaera sp. GCM10027208]|uniref:ArsR/SmtB family transcription factor n=1 Tax=Quadrisphaera sp. GCM10027208 TaxID=3273423 RepID=UPI003621ACBC
MADRATKDALFAEFAAVGKALGSPKRLELLDLLAQGPRSVDDLARAAGLGLSTCSAHLQVLRESGLVVSRRDGKRVRYTLAGDDVAALWEALRRVAAAHRPSVDAAGRAYLGAADDAAAVGVDELLAAVQTGDAVLLDVRPEVEYAAGHLPGALGIPLEQLADRLAELPADREVLVYCRGRYCALAHDALRLLAARGRPARRSRDGLLEWRVAGRPLETSDPGAA